MRAMTDLQIFSDIGPLLNQSARSFKSLSKPIHLLGEANFASAIALAQIESSLLDENIAYKRSLSETANTLTGPGPAIIIGGNEQTSWDEEENILRLSATSVQLELGVNNSQRTGIVGPVAQASALAAVISPSGERTRRLRGLACAGQWLRPALNTVYDPIWTILRDHLLKEGTIQVLPLPAVESFDLETIPGLSQRSFSRLQRAWSSLDAEEKGSAICELVLPIIGQEGLSAARIEELIWHRIECSSWPIDFASLMKKAVDEWADKNVVQHASTVMDNLISTGMPY